MTVSITKSLSPQMQLVKDHRDNVKLTEAEVERCKGELKTAKAVWEEAVAELNRALDDLIEKEQEPTLFDDLSDPPQAASEVPPGGDGGGGAGASEVIEDAEIVTALVPTGQSGDGAESGAASDSPVLSLPASPTWRRMTLDAAFEVEVDIPTEVLERLRESNVATCGELADRLLAGEGFELNPLHVEFLRRTVESMSEDDPHPVVLTSEADEAGEANEASTASEEPASKKRGRKKAKAA